VPEILLPATAAGASPVIARLASALDPRVRVRTFALAANREAMLAESRFTVVTAGVLGAIALILAAVGVCGVFAYIVSQQNREIGIRMALGARSVQVVRSVLSAGARPLVIGLLLGATGSVGVGKLLRSSLYGLSPLDPLAYAWVILALGIAAVAAVAVPVRRATRVDPIVVIRHE
jgi:ABC-type antimicrobial peptide transport system permease subunit